MSRAPGRQTLGAQSELGETPPSPEGGEPPRGPLEVKPVETLRCCKAAALNGGVAEGEPEYKR